MRSTSVCSRKPGALTRVLAVYRATCKDYLQAKVFELYFQELAMNAEISRSCRVPDQDGSNDRQ